MANFKDNPHWIKLDGGMELLDTPGVLWPKFEDKAVGEKLAFTGAVKDEIIDIEHLCSRFLEEVRFHYPNAVNERYKTEIEDINALEGHVILEKIAIKRGMLLPGGVANTERAAIAVLDEFRAGKLGRITLEHYEVRK